MISLELAQKLRDAGLVWEPQWGDWYCFGNSLPGFLQGVDDENLEYLNQRVKLFAEKYVWFPRLDQMLAEIERRGYVGLVSSITKPKYTVYVVLARLYAHSEEKGKTFFADTPEQAAGLALLWILQEGER